MLGICSLFIPASAPRMINAGLSLQADSLIFDLEDAVHAEEKDAARILLFHALPLFRGRNIAVRINAEEGCWMEDLEVLRGGLVRTVVVPKARAGFLKELSRILDSMGLGTEIAALIESARSLEEIGEIACATARLTSLLLGGEDYCLDLGTERTRAGNEIFHARTRLVNAASAYHLESLDTPFADAGDAEGLQSDAELARSLGFTGKLSISPLQIPLHPQGFLSLGEGARMGGTGPEGRRAAGEQGEGSLFAAGENGRSARHPTG